jgi:hypothetical protein
MEDILKYVNDNENDFAVIFSKKQLEITKMKLNKKILNNTNRFTYYNRIRPKLIVLQKHLFGEYFVNGKIGIIPERLKKAGQILKGIKGKAFIAGTFLFCEKFNDIDVYIISKVYREEYKGKFHYIHLQKKQLYENPIFYSASLISVSNFEIKEKKQFKRVTYNDFTASFQLAVDEFNHNNNHFYMRDFIFKYNLLKGKLLNPVELRNKVQDASRGKIGTVRDMFVKAMLEQFGRKYLYHMALREIKVLNEGKEGMDEKNLAMLSSAYREVIESAG